MIIGAVIVTYNPSLTDLSSLLESINTSVKTIVVVDNGSNNLKEIQTLVEGMLETRVLSLNENKGIGAAQNEGINFLLSDREIAGVILFDHDSHPAINMIEQLTLNYKRLKEQGIKVGAVGPVFMDPRTQNQYPIPVFSGFSLKKVYPEPSNLTPVKTSFLIASGCLIPRETFQTVGKMNEGFFIDYIDIEWSFRVQHFGYDLYTCPAARMNHQVGDERMRVLGREISIHSPLRRYYLARNSILMVRTGYIGWQYKVREIFYTFSRVIIYIALVDKKTTYLKYISKGWIDGLLGRTGRCKMV